MTVKTDVAPPGREAQVRKLKEKPGIDNPYAVAWASYEDADGASWMGAKCADCDQVVPVVDDKFSEHTSPGGSYGEPQAKGNKIDAALCPGGGADAAHMDHIEQRGGKWVLLAKSTGKVLGTHATRAEAEEQERAVQASKHGDEDQPDQSVYVVVWNSYSGADDPTQKPWEAGICKSCAIPVRIVDGKLVNHYHPSKPRGGPVDDALCAGSGEDASPDQMIRAGQYWYLLERASGRELGCFKTRVEAFHRLRDTVKALKSDAVVRRYQHVDLAPDELAKPQQTADGFWRVEGKVARTGVQEYRDGQGNVRRELRLPDDVAASVDGYALAPLTNTHPPKMLDPGNVKQYVAGAVGDAQFDGTWVKAPMTLWTADAIAALQSGRAQLSAGYSCRLDNVGGEWHGQRYDAVQRDIVINHVALVDVARAGSEARVRLDTQDAIACDTTINIPSLLKTEIEKTMAKLTINGMTFEVADANAQAAFDGFVSGLTKAADEKVAAATLRADNAEKLQAATVKEKDALQGKYDAKMSEDRQPIKLDGAEIALADATDKAKFDAFIGPIVEVRASARAALLVEARKHLGANEKFDAYAGKDGKTVPAKSDDEIKRLVIQKLAKDVKLDGMSVDYVQARYDAAIESAAGKTVKPIDGPRLVTTPTIPTPHSDTSSDGDAARRAYNARMLAQNPKHPAHKAGQTEN